MPVDLKCVQQRRAEYERSLQARGFQHHDDGRADAMRLLDEALEARATVSQLSIQWQKCPKKERKELQEQLSAAQSILNQKLERLPNWVDLDLRNGDDYEGSAETTTYDATSTSARSSNDKEMIPADPIFCLGGYQELSSNNDCVVLTGTGCELASALTNFFIETLQQVASELASNVTRYNLPAALPSQQQQQLTVPTWKMILERQHGMLLWDRQLPQIHMLQCTGMDAGDPRETARIQSWNRPQNSSRSESKRPPWHQKVQPQQQLQILALTGPSLAADSRPLQRQLMERVRAIYQQLAGDNGSTKVRTRVVPPTELAQMESSRLVVEGCCWPRTTNQRPPVCLAYLSNLQDYYCCGSSTSKIRHGTTKEGIHVVQGTLCSIAETLEWVCQAHASADRVPLPRLLRLSESSLAYVHKVTIKKGGKKVVEGIPAAASKNEAKNDTKDLRFGEVDVLQPTPERIRAEALSTPFGFLPFYYR